MNDIYLDPIPMPSNFVKKDNMIKVIGVGGGGNNAVNQMFARGIKDVDFMICNTDGQALKASNVPEKLQLGKGLTRGLGAGCNPVQGRNAAIESLDEINASLTDNIRMVFITAGMGGGTGTGAAPIIAKAAKDKNILTIGVVTQPFRDEDNGFLKRAYDGIIELSQYVDSLLIIDNQKLYGIYPDLTLEEALPKADEVLMTAVKGIAEIITGQGYMNVDFADVKMATEKSGMALMGIGVGKGDNRVTDAVEQAFTSPLLGNYDLTTAKGLLVNITSAKGKNCLKVEELQKIMDYVKDKTGPTDKSKRGVAFDEKIEDDTVSITVVVTGFKMQLTPPPTSSVHRDSEDVILEESNDDTLDKGIKLNGTTYDSTCILAKRDLSIIPTYDSDILIAEYEEEPAVFRRARIAKEKEEERKKLQ